MTWDTHVNSAMGKVYGMLRALRPTQQCLPIHTKMLIAKTCLIPTLLYGCEIFANLDESCYVRLNVTFNNIARYVFNKGRRERISSYSVQIFDLSLKNYLKVRVLIQLHKIVHLREPSYLFEKLRFCDPRAQKP